MIPLLIEEPVIFTAENKDGLVTIIILKLIVDFSLKRKLLTGVFSKKYRDSCLKDSLLLLKSDLRVSAMRGRSMVLFTFRRMLAMHLLDLDLKTRSSTSPSSKFHCFE